MGSVSHSLKEPLFRDSEQGGRPTPGTSKAANKVPEDGLDLFGNPLLASAGLDRLTHRAHMIVATGTSFRAHGAPQTQKELSVGSTP